MSLQAKLRAYKKGMMKQTPPEALEIMNRATEDLKQSGIMENVIKEGDQAPNFVLPNTDNREISLISLIERGPLVVSFYRGKW